MSGERWLWRQATSGGTSFDACYTSYFNEKMEICQYESSIDESRGVSYRRPTPHGEAISEMQRCATSDACNVARRFKLLAIESVVNTITFLVSPIRQACRIHRDFTRPQSGDITYMQGWHVFCCLLKTGERERRLQNPDVHTLANRRSFATASHA